jgi:hypothetical protein
VNKYGDNVYDLIRNRAWNRILGRIESAALHQVGSIVLHRINGRIYWQGYWVICAWVRENDG